MSFDHHLQMLQSTNTNFSTTNYSNFPANQTSNSTTTSCNNSAADSTVVDDVDDSNTTTVLQQKRRKRINILKPIGGDGGGGDAAQPANSIAAATGGGGPISMLPFSYENYQLQQCHPRHGSHNPSKKAYNCVKERRRNETMNAVFDQLRDLIPYVPQKHRLAKIKCLRLATRYIQFLNAQLGNEPMESSSAAATDENGCSSMRSLSDFREVVRDELRQRNRYVERVQALIDSQNDGTTIIMGQEFTKPDDVKIKSENNLHSCFTINQSPFGSLQHHHHALPSLANLAYALPPQYHQSNYAMMQYPPDNHHHYRMPAGFAQERRLSTTYCCNNFCTSGFCCHHSMQQQQQ